MRYGLGVPPLGSDKFTAPIFVVGCGRSGTSLLQLIINRHPELAIMGESGAFFRDRKYGVLSNNRARERFIADWRSIAERESPCPELMESASLRAALVNADTYVAALSLVMEEFARAEGKQIWGEKTPAHVHRLKKIFAAYPRAKVVHITRNPCAVVTSAIQNLSDGVFDPFAVYKVARYWASCENQIDKFAARVPQQIFLVTYEDLVSQPESVVRRMCAFLGVAYDAQMLYISTTAERYASKTEAGGELVAHHRGLLRAINADAVDGWRPVLPPDLAVLVESAAAPWFERRGYSATGAPALPRRKIDFVTQSRWVMQRAWAYCHEYVLSGYYVIRAHVSG